MSTMSETCMAEVVFAGTPENPALSDPQAYKYNEAEVWSQNMDAMRVDMDSLYAFLDLLYACDEEYIEQAQEYAPVDSDGENPLVDWATVSSALGASQNVLIGVQQLLTETLGGMGIENYEEIRVFSDINGMMRLVSSHDRQEEIEKMLNSDENRPLRELYNAATSGMGVAGGLIGTVSLPQEVWKRLKDKITAMAG